jgi:quinol-cytochrome oxidoreductase complex cytochrome b subunit
VPVVGSTIVELLRGGTSVGQGTLTRFYSLHTFVLPLITAVLVSFLMIRKHFRTIINQILSHYEILFKLFTLKIKNYQLLKNRLS